MVPTFVFKTAVRYALFYCRLCGQSTNVRQLGCFWGSFAPAGDAAVCRTIPESAPAQHPAEGHHQPTGTPFWNTRCVTFTCKWPVGQWDRNNGFMHRVCTGFCCTSLLFHTSDCFGSWTDLCFVSASVWEVRRFNKY